MNNSHTAKYSAGTPSRGTQKWLEVVITVFTNTRSELSIRIYQWLVETSTEHWFKPTVLAHKHLQRLSSAYASELRLMVNSDYIHDQQCHHHTRW